MGTIHWLEDTDKKRVALRFSDGSQSTYCTTKFEAFNLIIVETKNKNIKPNEALELLSQLKEFAYIPNEHIELHLIDLWIQQSEPLESPAFESCVACDHCSDGKLSFPHAYFTYIEHEKTIRIDFIIRAKDVALTVLDILYNYGFLYTDDAEMLEECIEESNLDDIEKRPDFRLN